MHTQNLSAREENACWGLFVCTVGASLWMVVPFHKITQSGFCVGAKLVAQHTKTKLSHLLFVTVGM